jgi:hypothetical protein
VTSAGSEDVLAQPTRLNAASLDGCIDQRDGYATPIRPDLGGQPG